MELIQGAYFRDLLDQPAALLATLEALREPGPLADLEKILARRTFRQAVLTGMGSSYHTLHPICQQLNRSGIRSLMAETSELVYSIPEVLDPDTLLIVVSQSGRSVEVLRLLERPGLPPVIAVTNTPDSPLAQKAAAAVVTRAGDEFAVSCKTYVAGLIALQWLADVLCRRDLSRAHAVLAQSATEVERYLASWKKHVDTLVQDLTGVRDVFLAGRGVSLATSGTGGLILKESTHLHAEGMSSPGFRHGPMEMLSDAVFVLVFEGSPVTAALNRKLVDDVLSAGGRAALVSPDAPKEVFRLPRVPEEILPLLEILPVQMISLALGVLSGREAGKFERATKVTTIE